MIFGAEGFIGSYLLPYLTSRGISTTAVSLATIPTPRRLRGARYVTGCDVVDPRRIEGVLRRVRPTYIYHLAAVSLPTISWKEPWKTLEVNVRGTLNVLEAVRRLEIDARVFVAGSSAEYGHGHTPGTPTRESAPLLPLHAYGVSKVAQDLLAYQYFANYGVKTIRGRIFNTIGPGKTGEVTSDIARQIVSIERGKRPRVVRIGNLRAIRDFTDVRDMVRALAAITERGRPGEVYNLASGREYSVREVLRRLIRLSSVPVSWRVERSRLRPTDEPYIVGDASRMKRATGWAPTFNLSDTLRDVMAAFRHSP